MLTAAGNVTLRWHLRAVQGGCGVEAGTPAPAERSRSQDQRICQHHGPGSAKSSLLLGWEGGSIHCQPWHCPCSALTRCHWLQEMPSSSSSSSPGIWWNFVLFSQPSRTCAGLLLATWTPTFLPAPSKSCFFLACSLCSGALILSMKTRSYVHTLLFALAHRWCGVHETEPF